MATPMRHVSGGLCLAAAAALFAGASWGIPWGSSIAGGPRPGEGDMFVPRGTQRTDRAPHIPRWSHAPERVRAGGALRPVIANSHLTGHTIALEVTWKALGDLLSLQARLVLVENIQKTVADYCDVPLADLLPKRGRRLVARPRELAMALAKELTHLVCPGLAMPSAAAITPSGGRLTRGPKSFGAKATGVPRGTGGEPMLAARSCSWPWEHEAHKSSDLSHRHCIKHRISLRARGSLFNDELPCIRNSKRLKQVDRITCESLDPYWQGPITGPGF